MLISDETPESAGTQPLQATVCLPNMTHGDIAGQGPVVRPAAAILRALGPPRGSYTFERLYTGSRSESYLASLPVVPSSLPQSQQTGSYDPSPVQQHGVSMPPAPDPVDKMEQEREDNTNLTPPDHPPVATLPSLDPVVRFLEEIGLPSSLADSLQRVGISDDNRIRAIGALPRGPMDRIEKRLAAEGIDFVACILIREGLKQRAMR